jgi:hypothetical protein
MRLKPFSVLFSIAQLGWNVIYSIFYPVHPRVQQRKQLVPVPPMPPIPAAAAAPPRTVDLSPNEVEILQVNEAVTDRLPDWGDEAPTATPEPIPRLKTVPADRNQTVFALLDEAYSIGYTTYPALIDYVEKHTGTGCSRRVIAAWKRSRKLIGESA